MTAFKDIVRLAVYHYITAICQDENILVWVDVDNLRELIWWRVSFENIPKGNASLFVMVDNEIATDSKLINDDAIQAFQASLKGFNNYAWFARFNLPWLHHVNLIWVKSIFSSDH